MDGIDLSGLRVPKASDVIAARLRAQILNGDLTAGSMLPPERQLAERSGLSRTVIREALRILEIEGLVEIRPGRNGGGVIRKPDADAVAHWLEIFVRGRQMRFHDVLEVRRILEPQCANLAAARRTEAELEALEEATVALEEVDDDIEAHLTANAAWHSLIAETSHNELLGAFMHGIEAGVRAATDVEIYGSDSVIHETRRAHRRVLDAVRAKDPEAAEEAMRRHVDAYWELLVKEGIPGATREDEQGADADPTLG